MLGSSGEMWSKPGVFSTFERALIKRYLWPGGEGRVIVLIASIGITAVALGVAALIVVMSVMNGARTKLGVQFAGIDGHASISARGQRIPNWRALELAARRQQAVLSTTPALEGAVMAASEGRVFPAQLRGLRSEDMRAFPMLSDDRTFVGMLPAHAGEITIGAHLAERLGVTVGGEVTLMRPTVSEETDLSLKSLNHVVTGVVETGLPDYDGRLVIMNLAAAQHMLDAGDAVSRINLLTSDAARAGELLRPLAAQLQGKAAIQTWRELNKTIFDALAVEQIGMSLAIGMVVLVALFNILSSLLMLVSSKVRDIAILRTMGASRTSIAKVFVAVGTTIGSLGATVGCLLGLSIVAGKDAIAGFLEHLVGDAYSAELRVFVDLPAQIGASELFAILAMAICGTVLVTLYPAIKAASVHPASVLRY
jgi:lipoprotein-releasing system permease protein